MYKYTVLREDSLTSTESVSLISTTVATSSSDVLLTCLSASPASSPSERPCPKPSSPSSSRPSSSFTQALIPVSTADPSYSVPLLSANVSPTLSVSDPSRSSPATSPSSALPSTTKSAVLSLISLTAHTAIAPSGIPTTICLGKSSASPSMASGRDLLHKRNCLIHDLISQVGQKRAHSLFKTHIQQNHYLLVYTGEEKDRALGADLRRLLEKSEDVIVAGPWSITLGEQRLEGWRKLSEASRVVLVIISRALFSDKMLACCLPELLDNCRTVPLFLECLTSKDIPPHLTAILHKVGSMVYEKNWNAENYVKSLQASYNFKTHLMHEIRLLENFLEETKNNPSYTCPCEMC